MLNLVNDLLVAATAADPWSGSIFSGLDEDKRFVVILTVLGCATGALISTVSIVASSLGAIHRRRTEVELKREMLDRGMSAEEVEKVVEAAAPLEDATSRWIASWCKRKK